MEKWRLVGSSEQFTCCSPASPLPSRPWSEEKDLMTSGNSAKLSAST